MSENILVAIDYDFMQFGFPLGLSISLYFFKIPSRALGLHIGHSTVHAYRR